MIRNALAGIIFAVLYGVALRLYFLMRARRDADRWHLSALVSSALLGGVGFYVAQQVRAPYVPRLLDIPAFLIMASAAASIPVMAEVITVLRARFVKGATFEVRARSGRDEEGPAERRDRGREP